MITIVGYGSGNVRAILNIYKRLGIPCVIADNADTLKSAEKLIMPGVGAFDETMRQLQRTNILDILDYLANEKKIPILGVCVGMQIMGGGSEEGELKGLQWIRGFVRKLDTSALSQNPKLPHMGWNTIRPTRDEPLFRNVDDAIGYYFLHSYCFHCEDSSDVLATSRYGEEFISAINHQNIYGVQFHPEKSHHNGVSLFRNFAAL